MFNNFTPNTKLFTLDLVFFTIYWSITIYLYFASRDLAPSAGFGLLSVYTIMFLVLFFYGVITSLFSMVIAFVAKRFDDYSIFRLLNCLAALVVSPFVLISNAYDSELIQSFRIFGFLIVFVTIPLSIMIINGISLKRIKKI